MITHHEASSPGLGGGPATKTNVWYIHPYAGGPGVGRFSRPYYLSQRWMSRSINPTVFCSSFHHLLDRPREAGPDLVAGVQYHFVKAREYSRNGFGRLTSMADFTLAMLRQAREFAQAYGQPDVVIGSSPHPYIFLASHRIARRFGALSIFEVRDLWPLSLVELAGVSPRHPLAITTGWLERYAYRSADRVVSLHPNTLQHMVERGLDPDRWAHVPNGVDANEAAVLDVNEPAYARLRKWQDKGRFVVIYAGALGPPNNIDVLLRAAARLRAKGDDRLRFLIVGRGELQSQLSEMIDDHGLADVVGLYPQVPKAHALALMEAADAGYISLKSMPIFRHGISPNKLYDYMLARLPVVSAIAAANDPVSEAGCGITVAPGDVEQITSAFHRLSSLERSELERMGQRGREYVQQNHEYSTLASKYSSLFEHSTR